MKLSVPQRTVADTGSFPVNPDGVAAWLREIYPLKTENDALEIYRGLKHSNRLHNDVNKRRAVISCFVPALREIHQYLKEASLAQPLPLSREFSRCARLRDSLLREETFAFKILLSDSDKPMADDARRAMQALARQAEALAHAYRSFPDALLEDAHQLYALAEEHELLSPRQGSELLSLEDHYRFILLLHISDLRQQRARQLPLIIEFLRESARDVRIERNRAASELNSTDYAVELQQGSRPEPALSLLGSTPEHVRWFNIASVLIRIDKSSARIKPNATGLLGSDILERQSLARLHVAITRSRQRRSPRSITNTAQRVVFGHKEICAYLLYKPTHTPKENSSGWVMTNSSPQGACLHNDHCRAGVVQVGELVSVTPPDAPLRSKNSSASSKLDAQLGVVRWVRTCGDQSVTIGVEFLARSVLPVRVVRETLDTAEYTLTPQTDDIGVGENALIIACKVQNTVLQTMLLPSYLFQSGDRLLATQGGKSRQVQLRKCLQSNGLFTQYSLVDG